MTLFFTADHHFNHANIIKFTNRLFSSVEEMDAVMINRWNSVVKPKDTVYHLGDFSLANRVDHIFKQLNGTVYIIRGNHDRWVNKNAFFPITKEGSVFLIPAQYELKHMGETIVLSHYPMMSWNRSVHGSWHLYGHVHGRTKHPGLAMDVGIDNDDFDGYRPLNLYEICKFMSNKSQVNLDK